ncbi:MAG TPA: hypothetical protein IAD15_01355 [Candidatus Fimiplasma intestinipullorum]|uniref:DUF3918 domain-containing protein n=1 Tax=Candidatus Fimiplasma intestinipullorum TaxID=2840825 RepID=A0A9D1KYN3_9FIRM|nr:hypothetical protein [Candidatus Fimiplasma intestinipullorum]
MKNALGIMMMTGALMAGYAVMSDPKTMRRMEKKAKAMKRKVAHML